LVWFFIRNEMTGYKMNLVHGKKTHPCIFEVLWVGAHFRRGKKYRMSDQFHFSSYLRRSNARGTSVWLERASRGPASVSGYVILWKNEMHNKIAGPLKNFLRPTCQIFDITPCYIDSKSTDKSWTIGVIIINKFGLHFNG